MGPTLPDEESCGIQKLAGVPRPPFLPGPIAAAGEERRRGTGRSKVAPPSKICGAGPGGLGLESLKRPETTQAEPDSLSPLKGPQLGIRRGGRRQGPHRIVAWLGEQRGGCRHGSAPLAFLPVQARKKPSSPKEAPASPRLQQLCLAAGQTSDQARATRATLWWRGGGGTLDTCAETTGTARRLPELLEDESRRDVNA